MRNIARFTGANVTGITINRYQVNRGNELNALAGLKDQCKSVQVSQPANRSVGWSRALLSGPASRAEPLPREGGVTAWSR
jgi:hypothetical protein